MKPLLTYYQLLENHLDVELSEVDSDVSLSQYELSLYSLLGDWMQSKEIMELLVIFSTGIKKLVWCI